MPAMLYCYSNMGRHYIHECLTLSDSSLPPWLSRLRVAIRRRKYPTIQQKNEWTQKWLYEKDALTRESTLCVTRALIGWLW